MAATLTMSSGGGQEDPFYPLQKATLPVVFPLEESALFGLDCKLSEKAGQDDYTQAKCEMDRYLSPQPLSLHPPADNHQKSHRDGASVVDHFFTDDHTGAPYTLNMNLYLPEVAYLRMGLCQQPRPLQHQNHTGLTQIKTESTSPCFSPNLQPHCPNTSPSNSCSTSGHGPGALAMETSAINMTLTGLPDFTSVFSQTGGSQGGESVPEVFVKQEMTSQFEPHALHHHDNSGSLFQLLNSGLDHPHTNSMEAQQHHHQQQHQQQQLHHTSTVHAPFHDLSVASSSSQQETAKPAYCSLGGEAYTHPHPQAHPHYLQQQVPYLPPSPPSSEPGSPDRQKELLHTMSPPPSYAATIASKLAVSTPGHAPGPGPSSLALPLTSGLAPVSGQAPVLPQAPEITTTPTPAQTTVSIRYSRRNNPDLEKRRIHHCDYPG
ncbi:hypothetical protein JOB18_029500 [Solea senegalensis]|nr:Krueppel-like factor 5 [Solea senegalensis]KAG7525622.1 hypothetical protein JOB18_029500 [Solea senegalensis]